MNPTEYQAQAARTLIFEPDHAIPGRSIMIIWCATGLCGESGELTDLLKKAIFHRHNLDFAKATHELGDVLWYVAALCTLLNLDMGKVMQANINKLQERYPNGYNSEDSKHG